jgi:hypothetical protein
VIVRGLWCVLPGPPLLQQRGGRVLELCDNAGMMAFSRVGTKMGLGLCCGEATRLGLGKGNQCKYFLCCVEISELMDGWCGGWPVR